MEKQETILKSMPISKALFKLSIPAIIAMLVMSLYNVVDTIFISQGTGKLGLAGVTLVLPIQMLTIAVALTIGMGASSIISRKLGEKKKDDAEHILGNSVVIAGIAGITFSVLLFLFKDAVLGVLGASPEVFPFAREYLSVVLFEAFFLSIAFTLNNITRAEGDPKTAMIVMIIGALTNMTLDPIFIFGFGWGVTGAALATVIAQFVGAILVFIHFFSKKSVLHFHPHNLTLKLSTIYEIFRIGSASFARQVSFAIMIIIMNLLLVIHGGTVAVAAVGIVQRFQMIIFMPIIGVMQGFMPIAGYNYGAKKFKRLREVLTLATKTTTIMGVVSFMIVMIFAGLIVRIFTSEAELAGLTTNAMRVSLAALIVIGYQVVGGGLFQALGFAGRALISSLLRQVIILIPLMIILAGKFGVMGILVSFPIADLISALVTYLMLRGIMHEINDEIDE